MHQHPRPTPRSASASSNPPTYPERTIDPRDRPASQNRSSVDLTAYSERALSDPVAETTRHASAPPGEDREATKLNQIIQHFHSKAALTICSSRANLPRVYTRNGEVKQNRWFNVILDDTDVLAEDLAPWRRPDLVEKRPPPLVIEVYLDTSHLSHNQALVIVDESGKRWDVGDALASPTSSSPKPSRNGRSYCEVVLERWTIELGSAEDWSSAELHDALPNVYKKGVVLFRTLYSITRCLPTWKLYRLLSRQPGNHQALRLRFRIRQGHNGGHGRTDTLYAPLCPSEQHNQGAVERYQIPPLACRAGPLSLSVDYRKNCDFSVEDTEALLSSRFLRYDEAVPIMPTGRSLPSARRDPSRAHSASLAGPVREQKSRRGAYGSLGTFHAAEKRISPVTELRQRVLDDDDDDDESDNDRDGSTSSATRQLQTESRHRASISLVTNPPFKAGSLASSPRPGSSPTTSSARAEAIPLKIASTPSSKRTSLNMLPQQALRAPPTPTEVAVGSSASSSPKPAPFHRYSSSFANRSRRSIPSRTAESNVSSGRTSSSSKEKVPAPLTSGIPSDELTNLRTKSPFSADAAPLVSSTEDESIASFISDLERAKDLPSLRSRPTLRDNTVNLSKYSVMRDPNTQLAEEMSASSLIQTSSTPPSRRLSNVPALSTSSSPSRALPPYAPHVRSRLSTHSIAEETAAASAASGEGSDSPNIREVDEGEDEYGEPFIFHQDNVS